MEGVPQRNENNVENLSEWRRMKEKASMHAEALVGDIPGYEGMNLEEKVRALNNLFSELEPENNEDAEGKNKNRFVAQHISRMREGLELEFDYQREHMKLAA